MKLADPIIRAHMVGEGVQIYMDKGPGQIGMDLILPDEAGYDEAVAMVEAGTFDAPRDYPAQPSPHHVWDHAADAWVDPRTPDDLSAELDSARNDALAAITVLRGRARLAYITDLPGQDMLYIAKAEEAKAYLADPEPDPADYPLVMSEVGVTAPTPYEVAQIFANLNALWRHAAGSLDAACFQAEAAVQQAPDIDTINAILTGLAAGLNIPT